MNQQITKTVATRASMSKEQELIERVAKALEAGMSYKAISELFKDEGVNVYFILKVRKNYGGRSPWEYRNRLNTFGHAIGQIVKLTPIKKLVTLTSALKALPPSTTT